MSAIYYLISEVHFRNLRQWRGSPFNDDVCPGGQISIDIYDVTRRDLTFVILGKYLSNSWLRSAQPNDRHRDTGIMAGEVCPFERRVGEYNLSSGSEDQWPKDRHLLPLAYGICGHKCARRSHGHAIVGRLN
jgi:hypothetical protein